MRVITTLSGERVELDGDVLAVIEAISRALARRAALEYGFEDVDLRIYLRESLFMSFNRFENDRMTAIIRRARRAADDAAATPEPGAPDGE
jgi:hypothetical protein